jgi:RNA:NAD 2'-phosphotransferase (TPT1/KptA family)
MDGNRIRAMYGHATDEGIAKQGAEPPSRLFHGTTPAAAHTNGVAFYLGNDAVWLADFVPPEFIECSWRAAIE